MGARGLLVPVVELESVQRVWWCVWGEECVCLVVVVGI